MNPKTVLMINVAVLLSFGLPLLLVPEWMLPIFGVNAEPSGILFARDLGVTFLAFSVLSWFGRHAEGVGLRAIFYANLFLQSVEAAMNFAFVAIGSAPTGIVPGELVRVVLVVLLLLGLRGVK